MQTKYPSKKTIITCHRNADFDALTSLIGISLFFPDAQLVFPGTQEKILQEFYDDVVSPLFTCVSPKDVDYENIERLVVVDTQNVERIDHIMPLLLRYNIVKNEEENDDIQVHILENKIKSSLEILIWDHHPVGDLLADGGCCDLVGSSCTLVSEEIKEVFGEIPCEFAYILGLGIYIDTGSFMYSSTTSRDYFAAAWLLEQGFSPDFVTSYTNRNLSKAQFSILNDLVESAQIIESAGIRFAIAFARTDEYVNDFASLMPQFMEMNPCQVLFALAAMKDGIQVVARSKIETVDVGNVCALLGGGGHAYAAAAMVKDKAVPELIHFLQTQISLLVHVDKTAKRLMTSPVVAISEYDSMLDAERIMSHYGFKAILVYKKDTKICIGWLEHQLAIKAISHGLGSVTAVAYMHRHFRVVTQSASLQTLMDIIVGERQRLIPVVDSGLLSLEDLSVNQVETDSDIELSSDSLNSQKLFEYPVVGVVSRTDLIRLFLDGNNIHLSAPRQKNSKKRNVAKMLNLRTPIQCVQLLEIIGKLASECGVNIYVVGGFVRDLFMDQHKSRWPHMDIDLVVESDGIEFAHKLADILHGRVREHVTFLTALVIFNSSILEKLKKQSKNAERNVKLINSDSLENIVKVTKQTNGVEINPKAPVSNKNHLESSDFELRIDIATARLEYYKSPAALPIVELSSIRMDLTRRDFTINAMAIQLNSESFGDLVDFFDGQTDIKQKSIRLLHALSFVEDPTRILRAIRFEQRYAFKIGAHCDKLIRNSIELGLIEKLSGRRIFLELSLILNELDPLSCLLRLQEYNIFAAIHPVLVISTKEKEAFLEESYKVLDWHKLLYLKEDLDKFFFFVLIISRGDSAADIKELLDRLSFPSAKIKEMLSVRSRLIHAISQLEVWSAGQMLMSQLYNILQGLPIETLLFLVAKAHTMAGEELQEKLSLYVYKSRFEIPEVTGGDLIDIGIAKGPLIGILLREVRAAKMDDLVSGFEEEMDFVKQRVSFYGNKSKK